MSDRVPLPAYRHTIIASCPTCGGDLEPDGPNYYWCSADKTSFSFVQVIPIDETDYEHDARQAEFERYAYDEGKFRP